MAMDAMLAELGQPDPGMAGVRMNREHDTVGDVSLRVSRTEAKGRGVFTDADISKDTLVEM